MKVQEKNLLDLEEECKYKHWAVTEGLKRESDFKGDLCRLAQVKDSDAMEVAG